MGVSFDAVLLLAFGGPTSREEIRPFLTRVLRGHPVPPQRIEEVVRHYEALGGRSPLNEITFRQARSLQDVLKERGLPLPVYIGMRHSNPFLRETLDRMTADGVRRALGFILSPHQAEASWERYQKEVAEARDELGYAPDIHYCPGWHSHPRLIQAWTEQIQAALGKLPAARGETTPLIFTAHSIPTAMAARSSYAEQVRETSQLVAQRLGRENWRIAYQSRSGNPKEPWLEPDIKNVIRSLVAEGVSDVVVAPIGFVCDHVEVLYDLDIEARRIAEELGVRFLRVGCMNDHPVFVLMMAEVIEKTVRDKGGSGLALP